MAEARRRRARKRHSKEDGDGTTDDYSSPLSSPIPERTRRKSKLLSEDEGGPSDISKDSEHSIMEYTPHNTMVDNEQQQFVSPSSVMVVKSEHKLTKSPSDMTVKKLQPHSDTPIPLLLSDDKPKSTTVDVLAGVAMETNVLLPPNSTDTVKMKVGRKPHNKRLGLCVYD